MSGIWEEINNEHIQKFDVLHEITKDVAEKLNKEKENLIFKLILEKTGNTLDLKEEARRKFPRITRVLQERKETYYYDNDTEEGLRIVTFVYEEPRLSLTHNNEIPTIVSKLMYY